MFYFLAVSLKLLTSCSEDNKTEKKAELILPRTILYRDLSLSFSNNSNKIETVGNSDNTKSAYTYNGDAITKIEGYDQNSLTTKNSYAYKKSGLKTKLVSWDYLEVNYITKYMYSYDKSYKIPPKTKVETSKIQVTLVLQKKNIIQDIEYTNQCIVHESREFKCDSKNNPAKNILCFNLLLDPAFSENNILEFPYSTVVPTENRPDYKVKYTSVL